LISTMAETKKYSEMIEPATCRIFRLKPLVLLHPYWIKE
jgi:hypothetical protein